MKNQIKKIIKLYPPNGICITIYRNNNILFDVFKLNKYTAINITHEFTFNTINCTRTNISFNLIDSNGNIIKSKRFGKRLAHNKL